MKAGPRRCLSAFWIAKCSSSLYSTCPKEYLTVAAIVSKKKKGETVALPTVRKQAPDLVTSDPTQFPLRPLTLSLVLKGSHIVRRRMKFVLKYCVNLAV